MASRGELVGPQFPEVHRVYCQLAYVSPYLVVRGHGVVNGLEGFGVEDLESCGGLGKLGGSYVVRRWSDEVEVESEKWEIDGVHDDPVYVNLNAICGFE